MKFKVSKKDIQMLVKTKADTGVVINMREAAFFQKKGPRSFMQIDSIAADKITYIGPKSTPLNKRLKKPISRDEFFIIMEQVVCALMLMQQNGFNWSNVYWDLKNSFINENTQELQLIYLPFIRKDQSFTNVFDYVNSIVALSRPAEPNAQYVVQFGFFLRGLQYFDPQRVEQYIMQQDSKAVMMLNGKKSMNSGYMTDKPLDYYAHYGDEDATDTLIPNGMDEATSLLDEDEATGLLVEEEEGTMLLSADDDEGTTLLSNQSPAMRTLTLVRVSTNERIPLNKPVFRLGKDAANVDYCVTNNAVSRRHADVITRGNNCFIVDLNSKNGTYINGSMISGQVENSIKPGDRIVLANEDFILTE